MLHLKPKEKSVTEKLSSVRRIWVDNLIQKWYRFLVFHGWGTLSREFEHLVGSNKKDDAL